LYAFSAFYKRFFDQAGIKPTEFAGAADLHRLPLVERSTLAASPKEFFLRPTRQLIQRWGAGKQVANLSLEMIIKGSKRSEELVRSEYEASHQLRTAGTRGKPIPISLSRRDLVSLSEQGRRMLAVAGVEPSDTVLHLLDPSWGAFWAGWLGGAAIGLGQSAPGRLSPVAAGDAVSQSGASVIIAHAQDLPEILASPRRASFKLRLVILAPQVVRPDLRREIETAAGPNVRVLATYYFAEARGVWIECAQGGAAGGFHTYPDLEWLEIVSPEISSRALSGAQGEIVFTGLDQRGTALARYRPGDIVAGLDVAECPYCGRQVDRIHGPIHRSGPSLKIQYPGAESVDVDTAALEGIFDRSDLVDWQVEVCKSSLEAHGCDDVLVRFQPRSDEDPAQVAIQIDALFRDRLGFSPTQLILSPDARGGLLDSREARPF